VDDSDGDCEGVGTALPRCDCVAVGLGVPDEVLGLDALPETEGLAVTLGVCVTLAVPVADELCVSDRDCDSDGVSVCVELGVDDCVRLGLCEADWDCVKLGVWLWLGVEDALPVWVRLGELVCVSEALRLGVCVSDAVWLGVGLQRSLAASRRTPRKMDAAAHVRPPVVDERTPTATPVPSVGAVGPPATDVHCVSKSVEKTSEKFVRVVELTAKWTGRGTVR
jgi:hypothetical protein